MKKILNFLALLLLVSLYGTAYCQSVKGAIVIEKCKYYEGYHEYIIQSNGHIKQFDLKLFKSIDYPQDIGQLFAIDKYDNSDLDKNDLNFVQRRGLIRVYKPDTSTKEYRWIPEKHVQVFQWNCENGDCRPFDSWPMTTTGTSLRTPWKKSFIAACGVAIDANTKIRETIRNLLIENLKNYEKEWDRQYLFHKKNEELKMKMAQQGQIDNYINVDNDINVEDIGKWQYIARIDPMDDKNYFQIHLNSTLSGDPFVAQARIVLEYKEGGSIPIMLAIKPDFAINARNIQNFQIRLDQEKAFQFPGIISNTYLIFRDPVVSLLQFIKHDKLTIQIESSGEGTKYATFDLHGLEACIRRLEIATGKKFNAINFKGGSQ